MQGKYYFWHSSKLVMMVLSWNGTHSVAGVLEEGYNSYTKTSLVSIQQNSIANLLLTMTTPVTLSDYNHFNSKSRKS